MNYVQHLNFLGTEAKEIPCILGRGAPTTSTKGAIGCLYMNVNDGKVYKCTAVKSGVYTWEEFAASWTEKDKEEIIAAITDSAKGEITQNIIAELQGLPVFGTVDENNIITVTSQLSDGTYTLKYENEDGSFDVIGTIIVGTGTGGGSGGGDSGDDDEPVVIVNLLESAVGAKGTVLNGTGYVNGYYLSGGAANGTSENENYSYMGTDAACFSTGFMPYTKAQLQAKTPIYVKGIAVDKTNSHVRIGYYDTYAQTTYLDPIKLSSSYYSVTELGTNYYKIEPVSVDGILETSMGKLDIAYFRLSLNGSGEGVIITVGQEIP